MTKFPNLVIECIFDHLEVDDLRKLMATEGPLAMFAQRSLLLHKCRTIKDTIHQHRRKLSGYSIFVFYYAKYVWIRDNAKPVSIFSNTSNEWKKMNEEEKQLWSKIGSGIYDDRILCELDYNFQQRKLLTLQ